MGATIEVAKLHYGEMVVDGVDNCLSQVHAEPRPFISFAQNDEIPSGVLIATDFWGGGKVWTELPVTPICHNGSWGLFESHDSFSAPYEGAYWFIIP